MNQEKLDDIRRMRSEGYTYQKIGDKYGICRERVRQILSHPAEIGRHYGKKCIDYDIGKWMDDKQYSARDIAKEAGIPYWKVRNCLYVDTYVSHREQTLKTIKDRCHG